MDNLPILEPLEKLDYQTLSTVYLDKHGKPLKPVQRHSNSKVTVPQSMNCPKCGAPSDYLYANNGDKGQYQCKVCSCLFSDKNRFSKEAILRCPHCSKTLEKIKERKDFFVFKCKNNHCPYYLKKRNQMSAKEKNRFKKNPQAFKIRYIFRQFHIDFLPLSKRSRELPRVDLSNTHASPHTLGLILTYHVNYGLSARRTAKQVIGLTNDDPVSTKFRPLKQITERLNRTFKGNYRSTHGFGSEKGSVSYVTLFVAYFNFLRPHTSLEGKVPVVNPALSALPTMPARWTKRIELAQRWIMEQRLA